MSRDDKNLCIGCNLCKKVYPVINRLQDNMYQVKVYACQNKNKDITLKSSSGGIFTLLAKCILSKNGIVFGTKFNENLELIHDYIESESELQYFRGSKYVQSNINYVFRDVKKISRR